MCKYCRCAECPPRCPSYRPGVIGHCHKCGCEITEDDEYYLFPDDEMWCEDCVFDEFHRSPKN